MKVLTFEVPRHASAGPCSRCPLLGAEYEPPRCSILDVEVEAQNDAWVTPKDCPLLQGDIVVKMVEEESR